MTTPRRSTRRQNRSPVGPLENLPSHVRPLFRLDDDFDPLPEPDEGDWLAEYDGSGQTFEHFVHSRPNAPTQERDAIYIVPLKPFQHRLAPSLARLETFTEAYFSMPAKVHPPVSIDPYDVTERNDPRSGRRQLLTRDLLQIVHAHLPPDAFCMIAVTMVDLYPDPDWNFVFGQASYRDRVGVYSFARYGTDASDPLLKRSMKVMAHEIGHMFGLRHCTFAKCGMNGSNHLQESDRRPIHLCPIDLRKLHWSIEFEPVERYRRLRRIYEEFELLRPARWIENRLECIEASEEE
jgi:archaemetzincin